MRITRPLALLLCFAFVAACAAPSPGSTGEAGGGQPAVAAPNSEPKTIAIAFRYEKNDLSTKTLSQAGQEYRPVFNAGLSIMGGKGVAQPQLAVDIPQLGSEAWRVSPTGDMETTWKLKPGLTWQYGEPLNA